MDSLKKITVLIFLLSLEFAAAQEPVPISELESKQSEAKRYVVIELYTDWCGICAIQEKKIAKDEELIEFLENEFYFVRFNAESVESFVLNGQVYENRQNKIHDFARAVLGDSVTFPAWVVLNPESEIVFYHNGLLEPEKLDLLLLKLKE